MINNVNRKEKLISHILECIQKVRKRNPLIHILPNMITAAFTADVAAAVGARPLMAVAPEEMYEITSHAEALVVNMGQPTQEKAEAAQIALTAAARNHIPAVLDPVGSGASSYRQKIIRNLLHIEWEGMVKGNRAEMQSIQKNTILFEGVDCPDFLGELEVEYPRTEGRIYAVTGKTDVILSQTKMIMMKHLTEKQPFPVVGTGCAAGVLCGVFLSAEKDKMIAAAAAFGLIGYAQERAKGAYGTRKNTILDYLSHPKQEDLYEYLMQILCFEC